MRDAFQQQLRQIGRAQSAAYRDGRFAEVEAKLNALLNDAADDTERALVWAHLAGHHQVCALEVDPAAVHRALHALQTAAQLQPDDALNWLALAEHFHYHDVNLDEAARHVETALAAAQREGNLLRQTLGVRIRIALKRLDMATVQASLEALLSVVSGNLDVALEDDFLASIPPGGISADLVARYQAMVASARGKR